MPDEAVAIKLFGVADIRVRMIDCVGYMVSGAIGAAEDGVARMVNTPWTDEAVPFEKAAEMGTRKVIADHSTIGIVVTADGSFTDIARSEYAHAEERVVSELKDLHKPFVVVLNSTHPHSAETESLRAELEEKYAVSVVSVDILTLDMPAIENIFEKVLYEFPVREITYKIPKWTANLKSDHWLNLQLHDFIGASAGSGERLRMVMEGISENVCESFSPRIEAVKLSSGDITSVLAIDNSVFYKIVGEENGISVKNESDLFTLLTDLLVKKQSTEILSGAIASALSAGYGIVYPDFTSLKLSEPEMYADSGKYGICLKAAAEALHVIKTDITSEISPVIGDETECKLFLEKLISEYRNDPQSLWNTEIFGRKLADMMQDNVRNKLVSLSEDTKNRLNRAVTKITNTQKGGLFIFWL